MSSEITNEPCTCDGAVAKIVFDCETYPFRPNEMAPKVVCLGAINSKGVVDIWDRAPDDFCWPPFEHIGHNVAYDFCCLVASGWIDVASVFAIYERNLVRDTMLEAQLIDIDAGEFPRKSYSLAALTGLEKDEATRCDYAEVDGVPLDKWPERFVEYLKKDVYATASLAKKGPPADSFAQARAAFALKLSSTWGITPDLARVEKYRGELMERMGAIYPRLVAAGIVGIDGRRSLRVIRELLAVAGSEALTEKGSIATGAEHLAASGNRDLVALAEYLECQKIISTYLDHFTDTVHPSYGLAASGRTTSFGPNIQNLPREPGVRECFVPREGMAFISCDYSALELHTLAQVCVNMFRRSRLAEVLNAGRDPHLELGAKLLRISYDESVARKNDPDVKQARQLAKAPNFGFPGGMGAKKLRDYARASYGLDIPAERCVELRNQWLDQWPEMRRYFKWAAHMSDTSGVVEQHVSGRIRGGCGYCDGANTLFQGLAADLAKKALWDVTKECYLGGGDLYGSRVVAFVHDEIIIETPLEYVNEAAERLRAKMIEAEEIYCPDVRGAAEVVAMDRWSKNAKEIRDTHGRLEVYRVET